MAILAACGDDDGATQRDAGSGSDDAAIDASDVPITYLKAANAEAHEAYWPRSCSSAPARASNTDRPTSEHVTQRASGRGSARCYVVPLRSRVELSPANVPFPSRV